MWLNDEIIRKKSKLQDYCKALKNVDVDLRNYVKTMEEKWKPKSHLIEPFKPIC